MITATEHTRTLGALRDAARESMTITPDAAGNRVHDPLRALIPGDGQADEATRYAVWQITGRKITRDQFLNTAPACRAALRRWAVRERENAR
jgi:hypothetical protein